ncbi:MAG: polysaccharide biosynthesis tyrosine autokinase [Deltaproteobacteria bacterium]|nr:polysaccharide biosynthesis tyrosine autokinase [Deltaproteobacteria bacterium]
MSQSAHSDVPRVTHNSSGNVPSVALLSANTFPSDMGEGIGLYDCWRVVKRYRRLIFALLATALFLTFVVVLLVTPNFVATSTLLIEPEPPQVLDVRELISESGGTDANDYYKTMYDLLKSRDLAASVIRDLNLENTELLGAGEPRGLLGHLESLYGRLLSMFSPPPVVVVGPQTAGVGASAIDAYLARLKIEPQLGTRLVKVSFKAPDPELAARITNTHIRHYIQQGLNLRSESRRAAVDFLENQLVQIKQRVQQSEAALNNYRHQKGIVSFDVEGKYKVPEARMMDLTRSLTEVETRRITAEAQMEQVKAGDYDSLPQVVSNPTITSLKPQVRRLQAEYANLSTAFNSQYPKLAELKAELFEANSSLTTEIAGVAKSIERDYRSAVDQEKKLRAEIDDEKERDLALNDASLQDAVLSREVETNRDLYKNVLARMQQIQVGEQAPVTNVSVVDRAVPPPFPSTPKKLTDLTISGLFALVCGIFLAFLFNQLDNRLKTGEEVEKYLYLPNLALAPDFAKLHQKTSVQRHLEGVRRLLLGSAEGGSNGSNGYVHPPARGDVYRSIRTAIQFSRAGSPPNKILVTSAIEGEGKTWTAVHVASVFAQTGAKTLLIDADLRRAQCHETLSLENELGLSEVLVGQLEAEEAIRHLADRKLYLLSAGSQVPNPAELLTSSRMLEILTSLSQEYQYIFIDSAPLMYASDTIGIATMVDGVVLVAGFDTPKQDVKRAAERLSLAGANILGVVLNRVDFREPEHRQYSRYYFSYERGAGTPPR